MGRLRCIIAIQWDFDVKNHEVVPGELGETMGILCYQE